GLSSCPSSERPGPAPCPYTPLFRSHGRAGIGAGRVPAVLPGIARAGQPAVAGCAGAARAGGGRRVGADASVNRGPRNTPRVVLARAARQIFFRCRHVACGWFPDVRTADTTLMSGLYLSRPP